MYTVNIVTNVYWHILMFKIQLKLALLRKQGRTFQVRLHYVKKNDEEEGNRLILLMNLCAYILMTVYINS